MIIVNVYIDLTNCNTTFTYVISYVDYSMHHNCQFRETIPCLLVLSMFNCLLNHGALDWFYE